ncbi:MAG: bacterial Ig-like domain-containing protein [Bacteroidales bacterium]|nr:bacterial Ig-like domain-containing protein [Bacteroidales bacterium]
MLDEIKYKTRKFSEDYVWFSTNNVNESWKEGYKALFFNADSSVNLFAEIENDSYRIFFDKIDSKRQDVQHRNLYCVLLSEGKRGSDSSKAMFCLLSNYFLGGKRNEIQNLFDEHFTAEFIDSIYERNRDSEVEAQIHEHFNAIVEQLQDVEFQHEVATKDNSYNFTTYESKANAFFTELEFITNNKPIEGIVSLVMTGNSVETKFLKEFDYTKFSRGLCLSMTTVEGGRIEKTIKFVKSIELSSCPVKTTYKQGEKFVAGGCVIRITYSNGTTETKAVTDDEISGFDPQKVGTQKLVVTYEGCTTSFEVTVTPFTTEGTASGQNAQETEQKTENKFVQIVCMIRSNPSYRNLLIIMSIIILALLVMVRSCVKRSGNGSEENSPKPTEQQCSPQSPDSCKKSTTDSQKIKVDSCKEFTKDSLGIKADSCKKSTKDTLK